jgi:hypothetical protein
VQPSRFARECVALACGRALLGGSVIGCGPVLGVAGLERIATGCA